MMRGHIVENTVSRVFREGPLLVSETDAWDILETPLDDQQRPSRDSTEGYQAPSIQPREGFDSIEALRAWARARCDIHLPMVKEFHVEEFEDNPMSIGSGDDLDDEMMQKMAYATIDFHLTEVERCWQMNGGPKLSDFRSGTRPKWPAPDGFPYDWEAPHPAATTGDCTLMEAWEIARPWFVDTQEHSVSEPFTLNIGFGANTILSTIGKDMFQSSISKQRWETMIVHPDMCCNWRFMHGCGGKPTAVHRVSKTYESGMQVPTK